MAKNTNRSNGSGYDMFKWKNVLDNKKSLNDNSSPPIPIDPPQPSNSNGGERKSLEKSIQKNKFKSVAFF